jgi:hypothetical protein
MMGQEHPTSSTSFLSRLGKAFVGLIRFLLRLLIVLAVCATVGGGVYFGGTFVYRHYLEPVPVLTIRLDIVEERQTQINEQLTEQQGNLQFRVEEVELRSDTRKLALDSLQERQIAIETSQADTIGRLDKLHLELEQLQTALGEGQFARDTIQVALETLVAARDAGQRDLEALRADLETLQAGSTSIESTLETGQDDLAAMQTRVADLSGQVDEYSLDVAALRAELSGEKSPTVLLHELQLVKAMELLTRARLVLVQNNLGLAQFDIQAGRRILVDLQVEVPAYQSERIARIVAHLDSALGRLPASPVAAADELEGAWQLLVAGLPKESPVGPASPAMPTTTPTLEPTPTPTAQL